MKIINLLLSNKNGGVEQSFISYSAILKSLNHEVLAIVKSGAPYIKDLEKLGIKVIQIENNFGYIDFIAINKIRKIINEFQANLVFAHVGRGISLAKKALKKFRNIPLIAVNHSNNVKRSIGADIILSVNKEIFYKTVDCGQAYDKSFVIPNFIDFKPSKKEFKIEDFKFSSTIKIGAMGRLAEEKGLENLIKAIKILQDQNIDARLVIAGSGELEKKLRDLSQILNIAGLVKFIGWVEDKEKFFSSIDIFCLPSLEESFGVVLLEAFAHYKPVIATNCDGPKAIIRHEKNGLLINKNSPEEIASAIINLKNNPELIFDIITNAQNDLTNKYSFETTRKVLGEILGK